VEFFAHLVPAEKHDSHEGCFKEEGQDAFDSQRRPEDIAHKPRIVRPVGAKFKFKYDAGGHPYGEVDAEECHPEFCYLLPHFITGAHIESLHEGKNK